MNEYLLDQLRIDIRNIPDKLEPVDNFLHNFIADYCGSNVHDILDYKILNKSIDARKKPRVLLVYRLLVKFKNKIKSKHLTTAGPASTKPGPDDLKPQAVLPEKIGRAHV